MTAATEAPRTPELVKFQMLLVLGTTMYGSAAELSGLPSDWWNAVSSWKQQSVFSLHCVVRWPSQSMSMSAFQKTAPLASQTATVLPETSSSVLYLPLEICLQPDVFASSWAAVGAAAAVAGAGDAEARADGITAAVSASVASRISFRIPGCS